MSNHRPDVVAYWNMALRRAWSEATSSLGFNRPLLRRLGFGSFLGIALSWMLISWESAVMTTISVLVGVVLANTGLFLLAWLVQVARVPALIHRDQEDALAAAIPQKARRDLAEALGRHDEDAVHRFWAKRPKTDVADIEAWLSALKQWTNDLFRILKDGGATYLEIKSVRVLGNLDDYTHPGAKQLHPDRRVHKALVMLDARRRRLEMIIEKYASSS